ncbi:MAG: hypothetical protein QOH06_1815 [Acidobacteriota bacterium]|jgi:hypothetical protein|nr:hypothetical protein [Acidobacteriota bacterium]
MNSTSRIISNHNQTLVVKPGNRIIMNHNQTLVRKAS